MKKENGGNGSSIKRKKSLAAFRADIAAWALIIPSAVCVFMVIIRPQIFGVIWTFFRMDGFELKEFVGFDNYIRVLKDTIFLNSL